MRERAPNLVTELNTKILELTGGVFPNTIHFFYVPSERTFLDLGEQRVDLFFAPFADDFHPAVGQVFHPPGESETMRNRFRRVPETDALDTPAVKNMRAMRGQRFFFLHEKSLSCFKSQAFFRKP